MSVMPTFAEIRQRVSSIHVCNKDGSCELTPGQHDHRYETRPDIFIAKGVGDGSKDRPFQFYTAVGFSPYHGVIYLWMWTRDILDKKWNIFIEVNDWILQGEKDGVTAKCGQFTRLLPAK